MVRSFSHFYQGVIQQPLNYIIFGIFILICLHFPVQANQGKSQELKILFLGDSLTEGYGIDPDKAFAPLIDKKIKAEFTHGANIKVIQDGISGATSASALGRLKWQLRAKHKPKILVLALGANDGLRGLDPQAMQKNLISVIELAQKKGLIVVFAGMRALPNYGQQYAQQYEPVFSNLAQKYQLIFMPFLLDEVAGSPQLNIADGIHPNEKGHEIIANNLYPYIKKAIRLLKYSQ